MKRSQSITILTVGGVLVGLGIMAAASGDAAEDVKVYTSVDECVAETNDRPLCEGEMTAASLNHEDSAPRFADEQACQQDFESCTAVKGVDGVPAWFMPAMTGFVLGRVIGQSTAQPVFRDRKGFTYVRDLPLDRRADNVMYSSSSSSTYGRGVSSTSGGYSRVAKGGTSGTVSISRGGFGASGRSASS